MAGIVAATVVVAGSAVGYAFLRSDSDANAPRFRTEPVVRGELKVVITATGTLKARNTVEVGAEVSGRLVEVAVDFNDAVETGQVLARIDPTPFQQEVLQARARLSSARAALDGSKVSSKEAGRKLERAEALAGEGLVSPQDLDALRTAAARAKVEVAAAAARVSESGAALDSSQTKLEKTTIRSPISGIVLDRKVEQGQTVTAGFQTPVLFQLATDLAEMELTAAIDEADVGRITKDQDATFTVDAFPNRTFQSKVATVRNVATTTQNVVTYTAILTTRNDDRTLRPGMTATTTIVAASVVDALLVPNEALRFSPPRAEAPPAARKPTTLALFSPPRSSGSARPASGGARRNSPDEGTVWTLENGQPTPHKFRKGESDGEKTVVLDGDLQPGASVITGNAAGAATTTAAPAGPPPGGPGGPP